MPATACVRFWTVVESLGAIWVWHDPEGGEPEWDHPTLPQWDDPSWVGWKFDHLGMLNQHPQEVIDNICGYGHLSPIHGSTVERYENEFRAHVATQRQCGPHRTLVGADDVSPVLHTDTTYHDPGVLIAYLTGLCKWILMIKQVGCTVDRSKTADARSSACSRRPFCHSLALVRRRTLFLPGFLSHAATCRSPASAGVTIFGSALSE